MASGGRTSNSGGGLGMYSSDCSVSSTSQNSCISFDPEAGKMFSGWRFLTNCLQSRSVEAALTARSRFVEGMWLTIVSGQSMHSYKYLRSCRSRSLHGYCVTRMLFKAELVFSGAFPGSSLHRMMQEKNYELSQI